MTTAQERERMSELAVAARDGLFRTLIERDGQKADRDLRTIAANETAKEVFNTMCMSFAQGLLRDTLKDGGHQHIDWLISRKHVETLKVLGAMVIDRLRSNLVIEVRLRSMEKNSWMPALVVGVACGEIEVFGGPVSGDKYTADTYGTAWRLSVSGLEVEP